MICFIIKQFIHFDFLIARGSMQDWNYLNTNDFEVTIELSCEKLFDQVKLKDFWNENKYALLSYLGQVRPLCEFNY